MTKSGYVIQMSGDAVSAARRGSCNGLGVGLAGQGFSAGADPTEPSNPRFFGTNASNIIYEHTSSLFRDDARDRRAARRPDDRPLIQI